MMQKDGNVPSRITRRAAIRTAALLAVPAAANSARSGSGQIDVPGARSGEFLKPWLQNALEFGNRFTAWQSPYGGPDPIRCSYRTRGRFGPTQLHTTGPLTRALYRLYDETKLENFKAADKYATFHLATLRDPYEPHYDEENLSGQWRNRLSRSWVYGKGLSPCYEGFRLHNPAEDAFDIKAYACYRWLQKYRRDDSRFGTGYESGKVADGQFSCDLGEVGCGLVGFDNIAKYQPVLDDATGLARFFLTDWREGSGEGVWSPKLGNWLLSPWPGDGGEHVTSQAFTSNGWGWSAYVVGNYLLRLYPLVHDASIRRGIEEKCVRAMQWCFDTCQYEDGAHGMFERDDKWVGMGAAAILLFAEIHQARLMPPEIERAYRPKAEKSWQHLLTHTGRDTYPADGYIRVTGRTSKRPPQNLVWLMAWTVDALLEGGKLFAPITGI